MMLAQESAILRGTGDFAIGWGIVGFRSNSKKNQARISICNSLIATLIDIGALTTKIRVTIDLIPACIVGL